MLKAITVDHLNEENPILSVQQVEGGEIHFARKDDITIQFSKHTTTKEKKRYVFIILVASISPESDVGRIIAGEEIRDCNGI
jgi:ABC-type glutathione transport system ATPase component